MFNKPLNVFFYISSYLLASSCAYVIDLGHIHCKDDNSRQVWVPKKCVQRTKSQNFKIGAVALKVFKSNI